MSFTKMKGFLGEEASGAAELNSMTLVHRNSEVECADSPVNTMKLIEKMGVAKSGRAADAETKERRKLSKELSRELDERHEELMAEGDSGGVTLKRPSLPPDDAMAQKAAARGGGGGCCLVQ